MKLNVFERDVERINALLAEHQFEVEPELTNDVDANKILCESCGSDNVSYGQATKKRFSWWVTVLSIFFIVYPFKANKCYHCYNCGHEFK